MARGKVTALYNWLDTWPNVAHWWLTGSGEHEPGPLVELLQVLRRQAHDDLWQRSDVTAAEDVMAAPPKPVVGKAVTPRTTTATTTTRRIGEGSVGIAYTGRWRDARYTGYAGDQVQYATTSGATATITFTRKSDRLDRSGRPDARHGEDRDRRQGRRDGRPPAQPVRSAGDPVPPLVEAVANHTITITVVGSGRPVAIDEFVITR